MTDIQIRRIVFEKEALEIKAMQIIAPEITEHYPRHEQWLDMAIKEIVDGKRYAFGIYKSYISEESIASVELIGSIIIKKERYTKVLQLKNIFIKKEYRKKGYGNALFKNVEFFCKKLGGVQIKAETPSIEMNIVNFLNSQGFFVQEHIDSPYNGKEKIYKMVKNLPNTYLGDPFDLLAISSWIFEYIYNFKVTSTNDRSFVFMTFLDKSFANDKNIQIQGQALVFDEPNTTIKYTSNLFSLKSAIIRAVITRIHNENILRLCRRNNIHYLSFEAIKETFSSILSVDFPDYSKEEITGIIVSINSKYFNLLKSGYEFITFFKGGPIGKFLKTDDYILLNFEESSEFVNGGIKAYGKVINCEIGKPDEIWSKFENKNPLFEKNDYLHWAAGHNQIVAIQLKNISFINTIYPKDIVYRPKEVFDNELIGQFYLNQKHINKFLEIKKDFVTGDFNKQSVLKVFLSSTILDLLYERNNVIELIKNDLSYNIFSSEYAGSFNLPRETILKELESSDIYICLIGERYGYEFNVDNRIISATHDEFLNAMKLKKNSLVYVKNTKTKENKLNDFLKEIGDYESGSKFQYFSNSEELKQLIRTDIAKILKPK